MKITFYKETDKNLYIKLEETTTNSTVVKTKMISDKISAPSRSERETKVREKISKYLESVERDSDGHLKFDWAIVLNDFVQREL